MESPNRFTRLAYENRRDKWLRLAHPRAFGPKIWGMGDFVMATFPMPEPIDIRFTGGPPLGNPFEGMRYPRERFA